MENLDKTILTELKNISSIYIKEINIINTNFMTIPKLVSIKILYKTSKEELDKIKDIISKNTRIEPELYGMHFLTYSRTTSQKTYSGDPYNLIEKVQIMDS